MTDFGYVPFWDFFFCFFVVFLFCFFVFLHTKGIWVGLFFEMCNSFMEFLKRIFILFF